MEAKEDWREKDDLPKDTMDTVHWDTIHTAMRESKRSQWVFISKHVNGVCGGQVHEAVEAAKR